MKNIVLTIAAVIAILVIAYLFISKDATDQIAEPNTEVPDQENATERVETQYGFSYQYMPGEDGYTVQTPSDARRGDLVFTQSIFDTTDYQDLQEGTVPREAPASLTIEVYRNPMNLETREWITGEERSNYHLSPDGTISTVKKGGTDFLTYQYDGLYRTDAYVYGNNGYIYVFANMWDNPQSAMKIDMEKILETLAWSTPRISAQVAHGDIVVTTPTEGATISSPLVVEGEARGFWFFEASFPMVLVDWDGKIIGEGIATAQDEWMTESFVPFTGEITFTKPSYGETGALILKKDNPSGLPENDDAIEIPVRFR